MRWLIFLLICVCGNSFVTTALATSPARTIVEGEPVCADSFPTKPNEISAYSVLPIHHLLFTHLFRQNSLDATKTKYECSSNNFRYFAEVRGTSIIVESRYIASGKSHASVTYSREGDAKTPIYRHGIADVLWPSGKLQAREYYCYGYPVGFHRYFDKTGRLIGVANFSKSDYRIERNRSGAHTFIGENGGVFVPPPPYHFGFMEGHDLTTTKPRRIRFMSGQPYSQDWRDLDLMTSVATWTSEGNQGHIVWNKSFRGQLINEASGYKPFWEHFQRDRLQKPGKDPVDPQTEKILRCPWIDEAMSVAKEHRAFSFPQLQYVSDADRMSTPRAEYMACIERPNASCLLQFGLEQAKQENNHRDIFLQGAAAVAVAVGQPRQAIEAMDAILQGKSGFSMLDPYLALPSVTKSGAAKKASQPAMANEFAQRAFDHATAPRPAHEQRSTTEALLAIARPLAHSGYVELARRAYEQVRESHPADADKIYTEIGMAELKAGHTDEAQAIIAELRNAVPQAQKRPKSERYSGRPHPEEAYIRALAMVARGAMEGGYREQALANVERIEKTLASRELASVSEALAAMYARLGMIDQAKRHLASIKHRNAETTMKSASLFCDAGQVESGLALLHSLPDEGSRPPSSDSTKMTAGLAVSLARCGQGGEALRKFELAKKIAEATPSCNSDMCWNFTAIAQQELATALIEVDELDLAETWGYVAKSRPEQQLLWAFKQTERGRFESANAAISRVKENKYLLGQPELGYQLLMIEAGTLSRQGDVERSNASWNEAVNIARTIGAPTNRAAALERLAHIKAARGELASASALLDEALVDYDLTLAGSASQAGMVLDAATEGFAKLAGDFARLGQFEKAQEVAGALMNMPGLFVHRRNVSTLANHLEIKLLLATVGNENTSATLAKLQSYPPSLSKLLAVDEVNRYQVTDSGLAGKNRAVLTQVMNANEYLDSATSDVERRQMIGVFASWLRRAKDDADARRSLSKLFELSVRVANPAWRARTLCELGYTAGLIDPESKEPLFKEGARLAEQYKQRFFPLDPPPTGACAFWLVLANDREAAEQLRNLPMRSIQEYAQRSQGLGRWAYSGDLLSNAIAFFESEHGEFFVDWLGMFRH